MIKKVLYKVGIVLRNPSLNTQIEYLKKTDNLPIFELESIQIEKM